MPEGKNGQDDFLSRFLSGTLHDPAPAPQAVALPWWAINNEAPAESNVFSQPRTLLAQQQQQAIAQRNAAKQAEQQQEQALDQQARLYFANTGATEQDIANFQERMRVTGQQMYDQRLTQQSNQFKDDQFKALIGYNKIRNTIGNVPGRNNDALTRTLQKTIAAPTGSAGNPEPGFDRSFLESCGTINPAFKKKVIEMTGGDVNQFAAAAQALVDGKIYEHVSAPSVVQESIQGFLDWSHQHTLAKPLYYSTTGTIASVKALVNAGGFMGHMLTSAGQILTTGDPA